MPKDIHAPAPRKKLNFALDAGMDAHKVGRSLDLVKIAADMSRPVKIRFSATICPATVLSRRACPDTAAGHLTFEGLKVKMSPTSFTRTVARWRI